MSTELSLFDVVDEDRWTPPRQLVLASAGSGKTFRISSGIIALLARDEAPDDIFASTFTRKAAGEILDRVLLRLAVACLDPKEARELAVHAELIPGDLDGAGQAGSTDGKAGSAGPQPGAGEYDCAFWTTVLRRAVRRLHRMNIGTLDAFFLRIVAAFGHELGMPANWNIGDENTFARLRSLALQDVLREHDIAVLLPLIRSMTRNPLTRQLHEGLLRKLRTLVSVHYALDPATTDHWAGFDGIAAGADERVLEQERLRLAARVQSLEVPKTKKGEPRALYVNAFATMQALLQAGDWQSFLKLTLVTNLHTTGRYGPIEVPDDVLDFINDAWDLARREVGFRMVRRSHALGRFATLYADALELRRVELAAYEFDDITRMLGGEDPLGTRPDLYYRLDAQTKHVLLDEFQDTSVPQWQAIEPLADELLSGHADERGAIIVADPKQSIYGWRGGTPDLVRHLRGTYALDDALLAKSWRSSRVVLDFVNDVHHALADEAVWAGSEVEQHVDVARDWLREFAEHAPAKDLPGHVEFRIGPQDEGSGEARPRLMRCAAEHVARLLQEAPGRSIGVLTRTNAAVARMMLNLKDLGVHASEEGGNALTDAAPVVAILAMLRMADNPGNMVARYHVARSPLGAALGYTDHTDTAATLERTSDLRRRLLDDGYGPTITALAGRLRDAADAREQRRLAQLGELAFRFDSNATLRPSDFVHFVRHERVEDPVAANVRVMTVHQAKGLEFDIVVLPEFDAPLVRSRYQSVLAYRTSPGAPVTRAFPFVPKALCALFPELTELAAAQEQAFRNELRDGLSGMYVALTRAKHALHIIAKPNQGNGRTPARIILRALAPDAESLAEGDIVFQRGDGGWHEQLSAREAAEAKTSDRPEAVPSPARPTPPLILRQSTGRTRALPRRSPSQLEGGGRVDLGMILRLGPAAARGSIAHRWFEEIEWLDDGAPSDARLRELALSLQPTPAADDLDALIAGFRGWLNAPTIAQFLRRERWDAGSVVETEVPFITRTGEFMVEGFIDRLVLTRKDGRVVAAAVIDFKTDAVSKPAELEDRAAHYRPQVDAYRRAVAGMYGLADDAVEGWLVFLEAGDVRRAT